MNTKPVPTTWSDRFGNVIDVSRPTTENIGLLPIGYVIPGCGTVEGVSDTAYRTDNGWWSFDIVHGRPGAATPLVTLDDSCRPTCAARRYPNAECVCAELEALGR